MLRQQKDDVTDENKRVKQSIQELKELSANYQAELSNVRGTCTNMWAGVSERYTTLWAGVQFQLDHFFFFSVTNGTCVVYACVSSMTHMACSL